MFGTFWRLKHDPIFGTFLMKQLFLFNKEFTCFLQDSKINFKGIMELVQ